MEKKIRSSASSGAVRGSIFALVILLAASIVFGAIWFDSAEAETRLAAALESQYWIAKQDFDYHLKVLGISTLDPIPGESLKKNRLTGQVITAAEFEQLQHESRMLQVFRDHLDQGELELAAAALSMIPSHEEDPESPAHRGR